MRTSRALWLTLALAILIGCALVAVWFYGTKPKSVEAAKSEDPVIGAVREYIHATEGWSPEVYTVENTNRKDEEGNLIVNVIHQDDLKVAMAGGGKSLQLRLDPHTKRVVRTLHFQ